MNLGLHHPLNCFITGTADAGNFYSGENFKWGF